MVVRVTSDGFYSQILGSANRAIALMTFATTLLSSLAVTLTILLTTRSNLKVGTKDTNTPKLRGEIVAGDCNSDEIV